MNERDLDILMDDIRLACNSSTVDTGALLCLPKLHLPCMVFGQNMLFVSNEELNACLKISAADALAAWALQVFIEFFRTHLI